MTEQDRIIDLETRLTHLDDTVEQLNDVITEQQKSINTLEHVLHKLVKEHSEMKEQFAPDIIDAPPPHY
jgi:SlyX protein